jgi:hypothetical protein
LASALEADVSDGAHDRPGGCGGAHCSNPKYGEKVGNSPAGLAELGVMADPIQNSSYNYTPIYTPIEGPPFSEGEGEVLECRAEGDSAPAPAGSGGGAQPTKVPNSNAERTIARTDPSPYADYGVTDDAVFAGVAYEKYRRPSGHDRERASASIQLGAQSEVQVGVGRFAYSEGSDSLGVELLTGRAAVGIHNDDGSTGVNTSALATVFGFERTFDLGGVDTFTFGLSVSTGGAFSAGFRDADNDGDREFCFRASVGPVTIGACEE